MKINRLGHRILVKENSFKGLAILLSVDNSQLPRLDWSNLGDKYRRPTGRTTSRNPKISDLSHEYAGWVRFASARMGRKITEDPTEMGVLHAGLEIHTQVCEFLSVYN